MNLKGSWGWGHRNWRRKRGSGNVNTALMNEILKQEI